MRAISPLLIYNNIFVLKKQPVEPKNNIFLRFLSKCTKVGIFFSAFQAQNRKTTLDTSEFLSYNGKWIGIPNEKTGEKTHPKCDFNAAKSLFENTTTTKRKVQKMADVKKILSMCDHTLLGVTSTWEEMKKI